MSNRPTDSESSRADAESLELAETQAELTAVASPAGAEPLAQAGAASELRYQSPTLLGRGGMGEVLSVTDRRIGRSIALKRVLGDAKSMHERFLREAKVQACLEHPAIVPVYDIGEEDGTPFFTMKRLKGQTLEEILDTSPEEPVSESESQTRQHLLLSKFVEVCLAVEYAHRHGVVHRDIKPANIMLGDFGEVYLLDWGIAKVTLDDSSPASEVFDEDDIQKTREGVVMGTLGYMAPEQLAAAEIDGRADVFSLGVVLAEILSGATLIDPKARHQQVMADQPDQAVDVLAHLQTCKINLEPMLVELLIEACALLPEKRVASARLLGERLAAILAGDKDLIRRRELADLHANEAERQAATTGIESRKQAILESARALALNPEHRLARVTLSALLTKPPKQMPPQVVQQTERDRLLSAQRGILFASLGYLITFLSLPLVWLIENQSWGQLVPLEIALLGTVAVGWRFARSSEPTLRMYWLAIVGNAIYLALISRVMGPIAITPAIAMMSVCLFVQHGLAERWWGVVSLHVAAIVGPYALASFGLIEPVLELRVVEGALVAKSKVFRLSGDETIGLLLVVVAGILFLAGAMSHRHRKSQQSQSTDVRLQQWQLQQMVPVSGEEE